MPIQKPDLRFAQAVQRLLDEHGLGVRSQRARTGLAHSTVVGWLQGIRPQMEAVIQFARAFDLDPNEWLVLAGYDRIDTPRNYLWARFGELHDLCLSLGIEAPEVPLFGGGTQGEISYEQADQAIREIAEGLAQDWPEHREAFSRWLGEG